MIEERLERFAEAQSTPPPELFERLAGETHSTQSEPQMMVGPLEGAFLRFVVAMKQPRRVLEIGVFTGWSSIEMASALPPDGIVYALDVNPETTAIALRYAEEAGVADRIDYRVGPALETLAELDGPFDLVFIDADKAGYVDYYEAVLPKLADDGVILADNTFFELLEGESGEAMKRFNAHVRDDPRVEQVMLTLREGVTLIRKRPAPA
jgi:caffeoyl-CoA O-methyltransferase